MSIFTDIKNELDFLQVMEKYIGPLKMCGDDTYTTEEDECPIHGGHGCFRMKVDGPNSMVNCFGSCDIDEWPMDVISFVQVYKDLETIGDAARLIARDFGLKTERASPAQRIYTSASRYYRSLLELGTKKVPILGKRTPIEYQEDVRGHTRETIDALNIGWSDGRLLDYLSEDFNKEEMLSSGLIKETRGKLHDTIPYDSFVYPHMWKGKLSRFTFKNMNGKVFQIAKACWLNGVDFYKVGTGSPIAVVEGENDLATLLDKGWETTILCTNGSLSKSQLDWMASTPGEYHTFWDADKAGEKYTQAMWKRHFKGEIPQLHQWIIPEGDIDEFLQENELSDLKELPPPERDDVIDIIEKSNDNIIEEAGSYKAVVVSKDGETETRVAISDFTIRLLYVKVQGEERSRVIRIIRNDGRKSKPIVVSSEAKVSLRHWKILVANAVDASFVGSETDLAAMWTYVYSRQREAVVDVPPHVGCLEDDGWVFGNQYVGQEEDIEGDDDNIMWFDDAKTKGIAPKSLMASLSSKSSSADIPNSWKGEGDTEEFIGEVIFSLHKILKDPGMVLTMMGWMRSCAYSMPLFYDAKIKFFPFMLLWGRHGRGKSTLANWMLSFYDMADKGTTTVGQLRSGVGIERKLAYYRGLPYCIDELRADRQASEYSRTWRGWYNRSSRVKGTRTSEDIIQVPLNACLFFSGQDTFTDPAMRSRCIPFKFPSDAGDTESYNWLEDMVDEFPTIGYHWIRESMADDIDKVVEEMTEFRNIIKEKCDSSIPSRSVANYGMAGYFAKDMASKYFPDFDFIGWLAEAMNDEQEEAVENDIVSHFWSGVAGLQVGERALINGNHIMVKNDIMYVWYAEAFKAVANSIRGGDRETFSSGAVRDALIEESYFEGYKPVRMGATNTTRKCLAFNLKTPGIPGELQSVADTAINAPF